MTEQLPSIGSRSGRDHVCYFDIHTCTVRITKHRLHSQRHTVPLFWLDAFYNVWILGDPTKTIKVKHQTRNFLGRQP